MTYTPQSKAFADRLILDYTIMRTTGGQRDGAGRSVGTLQAIAAANWWLAAHIADLHTRANAAPVCSLCRLPIGPDERTYQDDHSVCKFGGDGA